MNQELLGGCPEDPPTPRRIEASFVKTTYRAMRARKIEAKLTRKVAHGRLAVRAEQLQQHNHVLTLQHATYCFMFRYMKQRLLRTAVASSS